MTSNSMEGIVSPYKHDRVIYIVYKEMLLTNKEQNLIQKWAKDKNKQFS